MQIKSLCTPYCDWTIKSTDGNMAVEATVPGQVQLDLMKGGIIQDPYLSYNDTETRWVGSSDWIYSTVFHISTKGQYYLEFQGLDTICTIMLNGKEIGSTDNQFVKFMFLAAVIPGQNTLELYFRDPVKWTLQKSKDYPYPVPDGYAVEQNGERNRNFIRKEQCSFSWDWGPCCLPIGIWKDVKLINISRSVYVTDWTVDIMSQDANFVVDVNFWSIKHGVESYCISLEISEIDQSYNLLCNKDQAHIRLVIPKEKVNLWFPNGYGEHKLYTLNVVLKENSSNQINVFGKLSKKIGFRKAELLQEKYDDGRPGASFFFRVNGIDIFAKGTNWIPADAFESRVSESSIRYVHISEYRKFLVSCKEANMNMIRVWGGGIYQQDCFYDICDQLGIMVWQEFMFACAMYPVDDDFISSVKNETLCQVKRLMSHPCIVLWSGNNENEEALVNGWYKETKDNQFIYTIDYHRLYHETIMDTVSSIDHNRQFISSSPNNGVISSSPFVERFKSETGSNDDYGDVHYYNYKDRGTDVNTFRTPRFMSEYGFQSMPSFASIKGICEKSDWNPLSRFWIQRNHHGNGMEEIISQMRYFFKLPNYSEPTVNMELQFDHFCYLSQLSQAICMKAQSEHYRRLRSTKSNCMGALYWQCNDIWQAPTWSSIEYNGNWKALHYFVKDFFAPVLVSMFEKQDKCEIHISNDTLKSIQGKFIDLRIVTIDFLSYSNVLRKSLSVPFDVESNDSKCIYIFDSLSQVIDAMGLRRSDLFMFLSCNLIVNEGLSKNNDEWEIVSNVQSYYNAFYPSSFELVKLHDPKIIVSEMIQVDSQTLSFHVNSSATALFVWLDSPFSGRFTKNAFLLLPGKSELIKFLSWSEIIDIKAFETKLDIRSLWDAMKDV